uniref:Eukaryotic translation initiation factor 2 subunit 2 n=1 Tax=Strigamia maritima TaxID=126957 RepID=T1JJZ6_STRMM
MKKKKKKKQMPLDINAASQEGSEGVPAAATNNSLSQDSEEKDDQDNKENKEKDDDAGVDDDFSNLKKKKKKVRKKPFNLDESDSALPESSLGDGENLDNDYDEQSKNEGAADDDLDFNLPSKKKKKKKMLKIDELAVEATLDDDDDCADIGETEGKVIESGSSSWHGSDRDYTYEELLFRVFDIMREKNPDMVAGEKRRFVMRPPQVVRVGTKKTSFANFTEICKMLHRQPKHLLAFLLTELGTSGSVDGNNQLIIKGRFQQKQIENVLRRYIKEYVTCHTCRSPETTLQKDTRLYFLQCETCGSRCSVSSIKTGFQAVTGKRAAIRAKNA